LANETNIESVTPSLPEASLAPASNTAFQVVDALEGSAVIVPSARFLNSATYQRVGSDLIATGPDNSRLVIQDYFATDNPPNLMTPDGRQVITPELLEPFIVSETPGQYAQAGAAPGAAAQPIGTISEVKGTVFAVRADGTRVQLAQGDPVYQGDVVETGKDGAVKMLFVDKTTFALGDDARLSLDELVFNPATLEGQSQFSILKGVFVFASGQIAKTDNTKMTVVTPVATIGIRGTQVSGNVTDDGLQVTVLDGSVSVSSNGGSVTLDNQGETTTISDINQPPTQTFTLTQQEYQQVYSNVVGVSSGTNLAGSGN
jgi:enamine deaminase RidA (YjgF/YER057c/UK114 family)